MITDKNTIRTQNNKVATKIRTVESSQIERDKIAMDVQAFIDAGGYVQQIENTLNDHHGTCSVAGVHGMANTLGLNA